MNIDANIDEKAILIRINMLYHDSMAREELYEATRGVWKAGGSRRDEVQYALSVYRGEVKEVYRVETWLPAGTLRYRTRDRSEIDVPGRWEFKGTIAPTEIRNKYLGKSVKHYFRQGNANPISYINC